MDITNGYRTIELKMYINDGYNKTDITEDFFRDDLERYSADADALVVVDIDIDAYVEYASDWANCDGDFASDEGNENRCLYVTEREATVAQIAAAIRAKGYWDGCLCAQLAFWADMADEWNKADDPEPVIYEIANKLGVEVI